jgi:hypothetical protein
LGPFLTPGLAPKDDGLAFDQGEFYVQAREPPRESSGASLFAVPAGQKPKPLVLGLCVSSPPRTAACDEYRLSGEDETSQDPDAAR